MRTVSIRRLLLAAVVSSTALASVAPGTSALAEGSWSAPPVAAAVDYQLGGDYKLPAGVTVVTRDWYSGRPAPAPAYSICYVNAFQTQADEAGVSRPDEASNWPPSLVLRSIGDDPGWPGEYLVDISTSRLRARAVNHVTPMIDTCADKGFRAVEFDNLDSWTRFNGTGREGDIPFGRADAVAYATALTAVAHERGLAVGQKNTAQLGRRVSRSVIGFDFAVAEQCGRYRECAEYTKAFGNRVIDIEYDAKGFARACDSIGSTASVVRRDVDLRRPGASGYRYERCPALSGAGQAVRRDAASRPEAGRPSRRIARHGGHTVAGRRLQPGRRIS